MYGSGGCAKKNGGADAKEASQPLDAGKRVW